MHFLMKEGIVNADTGTSRLLYLHFPRVLSVFEIVEDMRSRKWFETHTDNNTRRASPEDAASKAPIGAEV